MTETPVSHARLTFALIIVAFFMDTIDASIVQVALPTIRNAFGASIADSQWAFGAYAITLAGFTMLMGRAGDVYGQKKVFIAGLAVFVVASFSGGLALLLIVANVFDPALTGIVAGFQAALLAGALLGVLGFFIALRLKDVKPSWNQRANPAPQ